MNEARPVRAKYVLSNGLRIWLENAESYEELVAIAERILRDLRDPVMLCGPMTTGGMGDLRRNMAFHNCATTVLARNGFEVFDQSVFEQAMIRLIPDFHERQRTPEGKRRVSQYIIDNFYCILFKRGWIKTLFFLPDWETSVGATLEHDLAILFDIPAPDYPDDWLLRAKEEFAQLSA